MEELTYSAVSDLTKCSLIVYPNCTLGIPLFSPTSLGVYKLLRHWEWSKRWVQWESDNRNFLSILVYVLFYAGVGWWGGCTIILIYKIKRLLTPRKDMYILWCWDLYKFAGWKARNIPFSSLTFLAFPFIITLEFLHHVLIMEACKKITWWLTSTQQYHQPSASSYSLTFIWISSLTFLFSPPKWRPFSLRE